MIASGVVGVSCRAAAQGGGRGERGQWCCTRCPTVVPWPLAVAAPPSNVVAASVSTTSRCCTGVGALSGMQHEDGSPVAAYAERLAPREQGRGDLGDKAIAARLVGRCRCERSGDSGGAWRRTRWREGLEWTASPWRFLVIGY